MSGLYNWVGNIAFYLIFITVVGGLLPNKKYEKYIKLFAGMVLILLVLQPLTGSLRLEDKIAYYFESFTFRNESEDLKKELLGIEDQRLNQMIGQYEEAVEKDVEMMAVDMGFHSEEVTVTINGEQGSESFGIVTHIGMAVSRVPEDGEQETPAEEITKVEDIKKIEPVQIGEEKKEMTAVTVPDEELNRLRRKVEGYYGLDAANVEITLWEREG